MPNSSFLGQVVIITGASSGIGAATALYLANKGATLVLSGRDEERLKAVKSAADELACECSIVPGDVRCQSTIEQLVATSVRHYNRIDVVINNAGGGSEQRSIENTTDEDWQSNLTNNLSSVFAICRAIVPIMKRQQFGRIVNVSSVAGRSHSYLAGYGYSSAKAGLQGFTRHLASELGGHGITVNAVAPGITKTERIDKKWQLRTEVEQKST